MQEITDYFDKQANGYRAVLYQLHGILVRSQTGVTVRLVWGQPFYYYRGEWFAYLSYVKKWKCVELGFTKGQLLQDAPGLLLARNSTAVRSIAFDSLQDFTTREEAILETIQRALMLNE